MGNVISGKGSDASIPLSTQFQVSRSNIFRTTHVPSVHRTKVLVRTGRHTLSRVVLLQTAHSSANAGVLLGGRMHRERGSFRNN